MGPICAVLKFRCAVGTQTPVIFSAALVERQIQIEERDSRFVGEGHPRSKLLALRCVALLRFTEAFGRTDIAAGVPSEQAMADAAGLQIASGIEFPFTLLLGRLLRALVHWYAPLRGAVCSVERCGILFSKSG